MGHYDRSLPRRLWRGEARGGRLLQFACAFLLIALPSCSPEGGGDKLKAEHNAPERTIESAPANATTGRNADASPESPAEQLFRLRNRGKLEADRDSDEGNLDAAVTLKKVADLDPENPLDRLNLACVLLLSEDRAAEAESHLVAARRIVARQGTESDLIPRLEYLTGLYQGSQEDYAAAAESFRKVTELRPKILQPWFQRGRALEQAELFRDAEASFRHALEIEPKFRPAAYRRFMVLQKFADAKEVQAAKEYFEALPEQGQPDTKKCEFTRIDRRSAERAKHEPAMATVKWRDATAEFLGPASEFETGSRKVRAVTCFDGDRDCYSELVVACADGAWLIRCGESGPAQSSQLLAATGAAALHESAVADIDNDKDDDILIATAGGIVLLPRNADGTYAEARIISPGDPSTFLLPVDADHDGDLDVVSIAGALPQVLRNNADGTFLALASFGAGTTGATSDARLRFDFHDLDQGNDIDFVFPRADGAGVAALNRRDGTFQLLPLETLGRHTLFFAEDINNDGAPDLFACGGEPGYTYALNADRLGNPGACRLEDAVVVSAPNCGAIHDAVLADFDNDTDLDVILAAEVGITVLRNSAMHGLVEEPPFPLPRGQSARRVVAADLDADCVLDLVVTTSVGGIVVLSSTLIPEYTAFNVRPWGARDNYSAIGTVVEVFAGALYESLMIKGLAGVHVAAGAEALGAIDGVRLRWPQGIIQPLLLREMEIKPHCDARFQQKEGQLVSCPFLYGRGKSGWSFLTDVVGIAPLDEWLPPGSTPHLDPEEWIRIEGGALAPVDGGLELCITEELKETTYLDRVDLVWADHPSGVELYLDESTNQAAYEPLSVYVMRADEIVAAHQVTHASGEEVTDLVAARDGRFLHGYSEAPSQWHGWVERYDLGIETAAEASAILLTGRIDWYDSTVSFALAQHGRKWGPLRLAAAALPLAHGEEILVADLGLPAGMDRTVVAAFSPQPAGRRLTLSGHHRFLWDHVRFAKRFERAVLAGEDGVATTTAGNIHFRMLRAASAQLGYHGFSKMEGDRARHEQDFIFSAAQPEDVFQRSTGMATRYGDVMELIREHDDLLVVLVAGDKVTLRFEAPPAPASGLRRTYFLCVSGWAKESNFHNRTGRTIEPLPYRAMPSYPPPPRAKRQDDAYLRYLEAYQTRPIRF